MKAKRKNRHREFFLRRRRRRRRGEELPPDLVFEILKRLPVRSLRRFRCVSQSWRAAIDDLHLATVHWSHFPLDARDRYLACLDWEYPEQRRCSLIPDQSLALRSPLQIEIPFFTATNSYHLVGSCDGLIFVKAIFKADYDLYLWNPFTMNHKKVSRSGLEHQRFPRGEAAYEVLGLGFCDRSNDYKIVEILYFSIKDGLEALAKIYSLRTDSWRSLKPKFPTLRQDKPAVFFNGKLHWFATICGGEGGYRSIVSFDVADEVINEMALPPQISQVNAVDLQMYMAVLDNLLAVFISFSGREGLWGYSNCSVWVMKDYGMSESWTSPYTFEVDGEETDTFEVHGEVTGFDGFTRNGELLIKKRYGDHRESLNLTTDQYTKLPISTPCNLVSVVESLHLNLE